MESIENRENIRSLVHTFYGKIRCDSLLGPIFNSHIPEEKWPDHLSKLTDFWETNLFDVQNFKGNPTQKHLKVDKELNYTVDKKHFEQWLKLWFETVDELFEGERANKAKHSAQRMAVAQFSMIFRRRPENI